MAYQLTLLAMLGLVVGRFMGLVSLRLPRGEDFAVPSSHYGECPSKPKPWQSIPLIGYLVARGKCPRCAAPIPVRYPLIETASALIGLWAALHSPNLLGALMTALLGWNLLLIAVVDGEHFWIPDVLTVPLFISGLIAAVVLSPLGIREALPYALVSPLIGAAFGFGSLWLLALLYQRIRRREGLGGGDPILFGAIGAWTGLIGLPSVLLYASLSGLGMALVRGLIRKKLSGTDALPFGIFLAIGAWLTYLYGPLDVFG